MASQITIRTPISVAAHNIRDVACNKIGKIEKKEG